jgi:hypothetical protein
MLSASVYRSGYSNISSIKELYQTRDQLSFNLDLMEMLSTNLRMALEPKYNNDDISNVLTLELTKQEWSGSEWFNTDLLSYVFVNSNAVSLERVDYTESPPQRTLTNLTWDIESDLEYPSNLTVSTFQNDQWVEYQRETYLCSNNGVLQKRFQESREIYTTEWIPAIIDSCTLETDNHLSTLLRKQYQTSTNTWTDKREFQLTWNGDNIQQIIQRDYFDGWQNTFKLVYLYDDLGIRTGTMSYVWGTTNWNSDSRDTYTYSHGKIATVLFEIRTNNTWVPYYLTTFSYNEGMLTEMLTQSFYNNMWNNSYRDVSTYTTPVNDDIAVSAKLQLNAFPNPFNPSTSISYNLPQKDQIELNIYNIRGQLIKQLVNVFQEAGLHSTLWNGTDNDGNTVASGLYFCRIISAGKIETRKIILLK